MPIPRIIHQLWKNDEIPARWKDASEAVRRCHRDWEYRLWTDSAIDEYMRRERKIHINSGMTYGFHYG